jgi:NADP-dependent 3-hydroxy acid dehydrogenase YdfG
MPDPLRFIAPMPRLRKDGATWVSEVRRLEILGFDTVAVSQHVTRGWQLGLVAMAFAAASTTRLRVLSLVAQNDLHHPALRAKDIATIDSLSDGRVELGIRPGWLADDYTALGLTLESGRTRVATVAEEAPEVIRRYFPTESVDFAGDYDRINDMAALPHHPPPVRLPSGWRLRCGRALNVLRSPAMTHAFHPHCGTGYSAVQPAELVDPGLLLVRLTQGRRAGCVKKREPVVKAATTATYRLEGRFAVVTGASSGIGRAIALQLVAGGAAVTAVGRNKVRLDRLLADASAAGGGVANGRPGRIIPAQVDLTDDDARRALVAGLSVGPRVDLLVHSAGTYSRGAHTDAPIDELDNLYASNVRAPYSLTQELLPMLRDGGGDIVVVNSTQGIRAARDVGQFAATQHAMRAITDSLRQEVNADGIRVCSIHLGRTATPRQEAIFTKEGRSYVPELLVQPEDVANVVVTVIALPAEAEVTEIRLVPTKKSY